MRDLLIQNGMVFTYIHEGYHALKLREADVLIENGLITKIAPGIRASCETLDASGCMLLPGMINMGSASVASKLLAGLLQDKSLRTAGGSMLYSRVQPVVDLASGLLCDRTAEAIATLSLWEGLYGGTTTAVDICPPGFSAAVKSAGEKLGIRVFAAGTAINKDNQLTGGTSAAAGRRFAFAAATDDERRSVKKLADDGFLDKSAVLWQCARADKGIKKGPRCGPFVL